MIFKGEASQPEEQQVQRPWGWCSRNSKGSRAGLTEGRVMGNGVQWGQRATVRTSEFILFNSKDQSYHFLICSIICIFFTFQQIPICDQIKPKSLAQSSRPVRVPTPV